MVSLKNFQVTFIYIFTRTNMNKYVLKEILLLLFFLFDKLLCSIVSLIGFL